MAMAEQRIVNRKNTPERIISISQWNRANCILIKDIICRSATPTHRPKRRWKEHENLDNLNLKTLFLLKRFIIILLPSIILEITNLNTLKMTKKLFILILAFAVTLMFTTCKKEDSNKNKFTDEEIKALYEEIKPLADTILLSDNPDWSTLVTQYKNREEIIKIETQAQGFFIEFANNEKRGWIISQPLLSENKTTKIKGSFSLDHGFPKQVKNGNNSKIVLINTQYYECGREFNIDSAKIMKNFFINRGWEVDMKDGDDANLNFFAKNLSHYDAIYVNGHGAAALGHNWLQACGSVELPFTTSDPNIMLCRTSPCDGIIKDDPYINEDFINKYYDNNSFSNSIIYLTNCQSLKAPNKLAPVFINKGAKVVVGWDESNLCATNCGGQYVGRLLLRNMLISGKTLDTEFNNIDPSLKVNIFMGISAHLQYYGRDENGNSGLWKGGTYQLPTETPEPSLKITSPSYGTIYHCGEWVDIFVSGYTGNDWRENLEVQISCLVGEPLHTIDPELCIHLCNEPALDRKEDPYSFTFSPESPEKWNGRWARLIAHDKKNNTWSAPQYIKVTPINDDINGVVINGIRWATRNVDMPGTFAAKPESAGMFYQWNRKVGWSSTDPMINSNGGTTWDNNIPYSTIWEKANDPCPTGWRVPTKEELESLVNADNHWIVINGINGRIFSDGNQKVFFSAAGVRMGGYGGMLAEVGYGGIAWSSTSCDDAIAYRMGFANEGAAISGCNHGGGGYGQGFSVRCVKE